VGDKPGKYWDYNECRWVKCPSSTDEITVPAQQDAEAAEADDQTIVVSPG
jgi:hypothetical protein